MVVVVAAGQIHTRDGRLHEARATRTLWACHQDGGVGRFRALGGAGRGGVVVVGQVHGLR